MYSLENYKNQCYNPGSPNPTPKRPPLNSLPKSIDTDSFDFSPAEPSLVSPLKLKIGTRDRRCKRKLVSYSEDESGPTSSSPKKAKMEDLKEILQQNNQQMQAFMDKIDKKLDAKMDQGFASLTTSLTSLQENMNANNTKMETKMATLENEFTKFQDNVTKNALDAKEEIKASIYPIVREALPEIKADVKKDVIEATSGAWKANLVDKVKEHEHSAVVFGLKVTNRPYDDAEDFLENHLKLSHDSYSKICMKHAVRLGRGDPKNPPGLLMTFSHPGERNMVLSLSKNLRGSKLKLEKHVPKLYQKEHKNFKKIEWKLKNMPGMNYQTQIIFDGYKMLLRYKKKDTRDESYQYVIHSEYFPPIDLAMNEISSSIKHPAGSRPTPMISPDIAARAASSFYVSGMKTERTEASFTEQFKDILEPGDKAVVAEIKLIKSDLAVIFCTTWEDCARIVNNKNYLKFQNEKISYTMFSEHAS